MTERPHRRTETHTAILSHRRSRLSPPRPFCSQRIIPGATERPPRDIDSSYLPVPLTKSASLPRYFLPQRIILGTTERPHQRTEIHTAILYHGRIRLSPPRPFRSRRIIPGATERPPRDRDSHYLPVPLNKSASLLRYFCPRRIIPGTTERPY